eukprot:Skav232290  [mRNA]  locus=scaffold882:345990:349641:- [translate_table: standard]
MDKSFGLYQALEAERELRVDLEEGPREQLREVQLRHAGEVRAIASSLQEAEERFMATMAGSFRKKGQSSTDRTWQREVSKLRDELVQAENAGAGHVRMVDLMGK